MAPKGKGNDKKQKQQTITRTPSPGTTTKRKEEEEEEEVENGEEEVEISNEEVKNARKVTTTPLLSGNSGVSSGALSGRPKPEDFPDITVTCGTNPKKIHPMAKDVAVTGLNVQFHGTELIVDSDLVLAHGQRYAVIGLNGSGKTTLLRAVAARMIPIPKYIDTYSVQHPIEPSETQTALEAVLSVDSERLELEAEAEELSERMGDEGISEEETNEINERLTEIYERLDAMESDTATARAASILTGLGFTNKMQAQPTKSFSGGWRMRISLARALFIDPSLLILDGPTAHLDMEAVLWLEEYLKKFKKILLMVSHSQDFMNEVCTQIILLRQQKLTNYTGNYSTYLKTREDKETQQQRQHDWEVAQIDHMKEYIARFGHGNAKLARQAQSKEKTLARMIRGGLTEAVTQDKVTKLVFHKVGKLPPPVIQLQNVCFTYPNGKKIYQNLDFGADLDSRICLVGPNGAGKSTLLKLINGDLIPTDGMVRKHMSLRMCTYSQHFVDVLDMNLTPLEFMMKEFPKNPNTGEPNAIEDVRSMVGRFGITGAAQTKKMGMLSDGEKARVVFSWIAEKRPHFILFDEPTNALDADTTQSLADALNAWDGGFIVVSHDMALVQQVANEIYICDNGLTKFNGDIMSFKKTLRKQLGLE